ncbi:hypothetical protein CENSYa_2057 [Cenarchaeum symbiosum A]|uniref:Uncharacterized protein n=1 Tax=Cenarchaeum symbiosum (strain A) TaxID=414004 RepID=A0RZ93_CENSY|nr:hypothetical protein CENSYa_2057 [Cenarchaeum symbiosum A]
MVYRSAVPPLSMTRKAARRRKAGMDRRDSGRDGPGGPAGDPIQGDLGDLRAWGFTGRESMGDMREALIGTLNRMLDDPKQMREVIACKPGGFEHILAGFAEEIMNDPSRPIFRDGSEVEMRHLLLIILLYLRGMPVQGALAVIFGVTPGTASAYLGYGMTACRRAVLTPVKLAARMLDMVKNKEYEDLDQVAPAYMLFIERTDIPYTRLDGRTKSGAVRGSHVTQDVLVVCTGKARVVAMVEIPSGGSPLGALADYMSGEGGFLEEITRPLSDGTRWSIVPNECFRGDLEGSFPRRPVHADHVEHEYADAYETGNIFQLMNGISNSYIEWEQKAGEGPWADGAMDDLE